MIVVHLRQLLPNNAGQIFSQFVRYAITGGIASLINIGVYVALLEKLILPPNIAWTFGYLAAVVFGYAMHSRWSFRGHGRRDRLLRTGSRFFAGSLVSFALNSLWVWLMVTALGLANWAPLPLVLGVTPILVFSLNRRWVFK